MNVSTSFIDVLILKSLHSHPQNSVLSDFLTILISLFIGLSGFEITFLPITLLFLMAETRDFHHYMQNLCLQIHIPFSVLCKLKTTRDMNKNYLKLTANWVLREHTVVSYTKIHVPIYISAASVVVLYRREQKRRPTGRQVKKYIFGFLRPWTVKNTFFLVTQKGRVPENHNIDFSFWRYFLYWVRR